MPKPLRDAVWATLKNDGALSTKYLQARENALAYLEDRAAREVTGLEGIAGD